MLVFGHQEPISVILTKTLFQSGMVIFQSNVSKRSRRSTILPYVQPSYSLANLVWCNQGMERGTPRLVGVSVFSGESRVVQLGKFSFPTQQVAVSVFSGESRVVQRLPFLTPSLHRWQFQYSLANLVWCNALKSSHQSLSPGGFSILWRISCGAT